MSKKIPLTSSENVRVHRVELLFFLFLGLGNLICEIYPDLVTCFLEFDAPSDF